MSQKKKRKKGLVEAFGSVSCQLRVHSDGALLRFTTILKVWYVLKLTQILQNANLLLCNNGKGNI